MKFNFVLTAPRIIVAFAVFCFCNSGCVQKKPRGARVQKVQAPSSSVIYDDINYIPEIKTVALYNLRKEQSFPIITLGSSEQLFLSFDDLRKGSRSLFYTIEHCDANWKPSQIPSVDYLNGLGDDRIDDHRFSNNTFQTYTHYQLKFPNENISPKISGNYLLKVYEEYDPTKLLLTRRFFVLSPKVNVQAEVVFSNLVAKRDKNQKINFSIFHPGFIIQNPYQEIVAVVMQNNRADVEQKTQRPLFIRKDALVYTEQLALDFSGGNEFRRFDTRSFRFKSEGVYENIKDSLFNVNLFADVEKSSSAYSFQFDENGDFFILNQDGFDPRYDGDYAFVNFVLKADAPEPGAFAYVVGKFNAYQKNDLNRMTYDAKNKAFTLTALLKQGVIEYQYILADRNGKIINKDAFEGTHFATENDYQILIYYRAPGVRFDQLISFTQLNSVDNPRNF